MDRPAPQLHFGAFILDIPRNALLHEGRDVPLRRQTFDTLRYLVERRGQVVSKEELVQAVWATRPADPDGSVAQCIKEIRKALGTARSMIRTVPRAGYEFIAPVKEVPPVEEEVPPPQSEGNGDRHASEKAVIECMRRIARQPVFIGSLALAAGIVLTIAIILLWPAFFQRNAEQESYRYKPIGEILTGEQVTIKTSDGRVMSCIGGQIGRLPRRCWWN
jgi:DNA-binding winged helix-turn-helix (wHTH) protein